MIKGANRGAAARGRRIADEIAARARGAGFEAFGIADARALARVARRSGPDLKAFLASGYHAGMDWLGRDPERRSDPARRWPEVKSVIAVGMNYGPERNPLGDLERKAQGVISVYARGEDYHRVLKEKLKRMAREIEALHAARARVVVDTAPVMEKPLAQAAGLGWQGKHTNLVSRDLGSWFFLGLILTDLALPGAAGHGVHCGRCRACLDICPTGAFPAPFQLDARRCLSYLTIEHKGVIARRLRRAMGNRIYGCDDCLAVCPWNKYARRANWAGFHARRELENPGLRDLAGLDEEGFRRLFARSPVRRIGRARFLRNVLIAIGNSGDSGLAASAERLLRDRAPLVRGMAVWALACLLEGARFGQVRAAHMSAERDPDVLAEWRAGPAGHSA